MLIMQAMFQYYWGLLLSCFKHELNELETYENAPWRSEILKHKTPTVLLHFQLLSRLPMYRNLQNYLEAWVFMVYSMKSRLFSLKKNAA
jgi:hypothetical protein